jgi:hypothetical protein
MCSEDEKDQRMWQAMKRATVDRNKALKQREKAAAKANEKILAVKEKLKSSYMPLFADPSNAAPLNVVLLFRSVA